MNKPIVAIDFSSTGKGGGPYTSNRRVVESDLKEMYDFIPFIYKTEMGRFISLRRINDIKKQLQKIKPDIVHFSGLGLMGFQIAIACKLAGIKNTVMTVHGFSSDAQDISLIKRKIMSLLIEPLTIVMSKKVYGVSSFVANRKLLKLFKKKNCGFIYNIPPLQKSYIANSLRNDLGINKNDIIVASVGRITKDKGYHILEEVISKFNGYKNLKFVIVGDGLYLNQMKRNLSEQIKQNQVFFLGYRSDVQQILSDCNIFVLPTLHETLSIALLEASTENLPLIASNTGGVPEIIKNGFNGILVKPGSSSDLYNAILKLYGNRSICEIYGINANLYIKEKFNVQSIISKIDSVYKTILG
ncbi:MAG: glycosyltransferase [Tissierellia bacterium]|nr:glycosyltransferase [Tissierellia bacterium]